MLLAVWVLPALAHAATHLCVNPGGTGGCLATIQAAVDAAAADTSTTIRIAAGTYMENVLVPSSMVGRLTLEGDGADTTIVDGGGIGATIEVWGAARTTLSNLTFTNGSSGVLVNAFRVAIDRCIVRQNSGDGIGQSSVSRVLTITDTTVDSNGAMGVDSYYPRKLKIVRSTISNSGLWGLDLSSKTFIDSSTISGNKIGIGIRDYGPVRIRQSTIADNHSDVASGGCPAGIRNQFSDPLYLEATIIADNTCPGASPDLNTPAVSRGYNLIEDGNTASMTGQTALDLIGVDPLLGPLALNGGSTGTHALMAGSPAIGVVGRRRLCRVDQRLFPRDFPCDVGAHEAP